MDSVIRDLLGLATKVTVKFSIDREEVPFTAIIVEFRTEEFAQKFFHRVIPIWSVFLVHDWDENLLEGRAIALYVIDRKMKDSGSIHGHASKVLDCIEKHVTVPTDVLTGIHHMPGFSFDLSGFINTDIREVLCQTTKVEAARWFDQKGISFTLIRLEFKAIELAETFLEKIAPFWKHLYNHTKGHRKEDKRCDLYVVDTQPMCPYLHGNALELLRHIERYSGVTTTVFPGVHKQMSDFVFDQDGGSIPT